MYNVLIKPLVLIRISLQNGGIDMKSKLIAILTTGMMLASAATLMPVQAAGKTVTDPVIGTLPEWVPQDFAEAMQFYNSHGKTYVEDDVICLVRPMLQWKEKDYDISLSGSMTMLNTPAGSKPEIYELEIPEKPDPTDLEAVKAYEDYCDKLGIYSHDYSFFESYAGCKTQYAFEVELYRVLEGEDLIVAWREKDGDEYKTTEKFSFENKSGRTVETDLYSWVPDSYPEFNEFFNKYGSASVHDNYIAYCANVNGSTGASLKMEQSGKGKIKQVMESDCDSFELIPRDGSGSQSVILYQPTADGLADVKWKVGREWSDEEPFEQTNGIYEIKDDCSVIIDHSTFRKGSTVITFVDEKTGELIDIPDNDNTYLLKSTSGEPSTSEIFYVKSNPCTIDSLKVYDTSCYYSFHTDSKSGWYDAPVFEITSQKSDVTEITCKLDWKASGDANGDDSFDVADIVMLQKWLSGTGKVKFADWKAVDFCRDNKLNAYDLCLMKREYIKRTFKDCVEPENGAIFGAPMQIIADDMKMYLGPDESYPVVTSLPKGVYVNECGYQNNNYMWAYIEYKGQFGWIRMYQKDNETLTVRYEAAVDKPVIYLYPEQETDVHVELDLKDADLSTTYPKYRNGWDVTAYPDGSLLNKADGTHHKYLFWDAVNCRTRYDLSKGFCVAGSDTESFLKEKLTYMGLTEDEMNEFIVYWLPRMEHNKYNLISFQGDTYTDSAKLDITPAPDSLLRVFMTYVPLEDAVDIEPQQLSTFERKGFTVVEWGGSELKN